MTIRRAPLPVDAVLGELVAKLRAHRNVVLVAPPGAGKTTRVPQVILDSGLMAPGEVVVVLEPRRLAARLASRRIASERGVRLGDEVGYQVRFDDRTSKATRIAFLTEGILTRRIQSDATLEGIGAVVLDEFHERSIHADLALAFLREIQQTVRPELAIVVMSATLDPLPVAKFLGDAPIVHAEGRSYPVEVEWLEEADDRPLVDRVVSGVRRALRTDEAKGNVLAFLPGAPEIRRVADALAPHVEGVDILPLYGELSPEAQDRAVDPSGRRKVVLATNIAESSLTIEGVTFVVDAGLAKVSRHDPALGIDRLELVRISRSSADQRTGRAGRTAPGRALRLWTEKEDRVLAPSEAPELMRVDLAPAALEIVRWSQRDPRAFGWFEPPPSAMVDRALGLLSLFGAIEHGGDDRWSLTPLGEQISQFPVHPRIAMMLLSAVRHGVVDDGATIAALLSERDIVRRARDAKNDLVASSDVLLRAERWEELARSGFSIGLADRLGLDANAARAVKDVRERLLDLARRAPKLPARSQGVKNTSKNVDVSGRRGEARRPRPPASREEALLRAILAGYPDRVGRRRAPGDDRIALAGGGGARMSRESVVKE
ncbi:DEAD/DEAH box helicase, partial [Myxococcota bacterium]|nr:DEAD/DEAH box helicase [Myxococcota bacterium]